MNHYGVEMYFDEFSHRSVTVRFEEQSPDLICIAMTAADY